MSIQNIENEVRKLITSPQKREAPEPVIPDYNLKTMNFPIDTLPKAIKDLCLAGHHALQLPFEFFAVPALVVTATAMGYKYKVSVNRSMETYPILYACLIANAGSGKSPAQREAFKPLMTIQNKMSNEYNIKCAEWQIEKEEYELEKKAAKKAGVVLEEPAPEKPILREIYTTDATTEALAMMLQSNPEGIVIKQDELLHLYNSLDAYRGKGGDLQFFLSLWNSEPSKVNRVSKPPLFVDRPICNIIGAMTPSGVNKIAEDTNTENGFMDRILFSYPTDMGMIKIRDAGIAEETEKSYFQLIESLLNESVNGEVKSINLSENAQREYEKYNDMLIADAGKHEKKCSINSKILMYSLRFALIIHACENQTKDAFEIDSEISLDSMQRGIQLAEYFRSQTKKIYAKLNESDESKMLKKAIQFIKDKSVNNQITRRDIQRHIKLNGADFNELIKELTQRFIIAEHSKSKSSVTAGI